MTTEDDLLEVVKGVCGSALVPVDADVWGTIREEGVREDTVGDFGGT